MRMCPNIVAALYLVSSCAAADIFRCTDTKGNDKYQNFPCQIDSIGSKATAVAPKEEVGTRPAARTAVAPPPSASSHKQPEPGMKMNEVRAAWGVPRSTEVIKGIETWYYDAPSGLTRGVRFDRSGTVLSVTEAVPANQSEEGQD